MAGRQAMSAFWVVAIGAAYGGTESRGGKR